MKKSWKFKLRGTAALCGVALSACAVEQPQSSLSRDLVSGVTSSNGGGMAQANFGSSSAKTVGPQKFDVGNMAFPDPLPQGDFAKARAP